MQLQFTVVESDEVAAAVQLNVETQVATPPAPTSALKAQLMMPAQQVNAGLGKTNGLVANAHANVNGNVPRQTIINGNTGGIMPLPVGYTRIAPSTSLDQSSKYIDAQMRLNGTTAMLAQQRIAINNKQSSASRPMHENEPTRKKQRKAASPMKRPMTQDNTPSPKPTLTGVPATTSSAPTIRALPSTTSTSSIFPPTHAIAPATGIPPPLTQSSLTPMHNTATASTLRQQLEQGKMRPNVPTTTMSPMIMQQMAQQVAQQMVHQQSVASMASMMASAYMLQMMPPDVQQSMMQMMRDQSQMHQQQWQAMQRIHYNRHAHPDTNVFTNGAPPAAHK